MNVHDFLNNQISELQNVKEYITDLENKLTDQTTLNNIEFVPIEISDVSIRTLYKPKMVFSKKEKCNRCDPDRLIKTDNSFYNEYNLCQCAIDNFHFIPKEINIVEIRCSQRTGDNTVIYYDDDSDTQISFSDKFIKDAFDESDDWRKVYYSSQNECCNLCNYLNGWR